MLELMTDIVTKRYCDRITEVLAAENIVCGFHSRQNVYMTHIGRRLYVLVRNEHEANVLAEACRRFLQTNTSCKGLTRDSAEAGADLTWNKLLSAASESDPQHIPYWYVTPMGNGLPGRSQRQHMLTDGNGNVTNRIENSYYKGTLVCHG